MSYVTYADCKRIASDMLEAFIAGGEAAAQACLEAAITLHWCEPGDRQYITDEAMSEYRALQQRA